jgi:hypothetical protein
VILSREELETLARSMCKLNGEDPDASVCLTVPKKHGTPLGAAYSLTGEPSKLWHVHAQYIKEVVSRIEVEKSEVA